MNTLSSSCFLNQDGDDDERYDDDDNDRHDANDNNNNKRWVDVGDRESKTDID